MNTWFRYYHLELVLHVLVPVLHWSQSQKQTTGTKRGPSFSEKKHRKLQKSMKHCLSPDDFVLLGLCTYKVKLLNSPGFSRCRCLTLDWRRRSDWGSFELNIICLFCDNSTELVQWSFNMLSNVSHSKSHVNDDDDAVVQSRDTETPSFGKTLCPVCLA